MSKIFNIYCDESCHLEHDRQPIMAFGAVVCPLERLAGAKEQIRDLKIKHNAKGELKWEKVSRARLAFYLELVEYFFSAQELRFRAWIVCHKERLDHDFFNTGSHDSFYYKMLYHLLEPLIQWPLPKEAQRSYQIYLDVKDTRSRIKVRLLKEILQSAKQDWSSQLITRVQSSPAEELQLMQLTDLLLGAVSWRNRPQNGSSSDAKREIVNLIEKRAGTELIGSTPPGQGKFNFFTFSPKEPGR